MTIRHSAFTFDAPVFVDRFRARCAASGRIDVTGLQGWALEVADNASAERLAILQTFRFDPEWVRPPPGDDLEPRFLVLTALCGTLAPAPSLSRSFVHGYLMLQTVLADLGWPAPAVRSLVCGEPLHTVFRGSGIVGLDADATAFPWYAGWTERSRAGAQRDELERIAAAIRAASADLLAHAADAIHAAELPVQQMLTDCLDDAFAMLDAARTGGKDLVLVLD